MGDPLPPPPIAKSTNNKNGLTILQRNTHGLTSMGHGDELKVLWANATTIIDILCIQKNLAFQ